uniref:Major facilitator superfamily (MFS) profile domain-containing protein n=1 Tax=Acrobeloides nanus TaxID=290746 RepID=A0A914CFE4_9BILA
MLGDMKEEDPAMPRIVLKVYPRRWIVLLIVALLNNSNTMSWIAFAPIANYVNPFYNQAMATNMFSMVYMFGTIPVGLVAMWSARKFGLRSAILIAAWTNGIGGLIRLLSSFLPVASRFPVGITGQAIAAVAYPFIMILPTKVAGSWFPDNQRTLATTIGIMSNPLGVILANVISPQIVSHPDDVLYVNLFTAVPSILCCIAATFLITRSNPKLPPTISASQQRMDFFAGVKACFTNSEYLWLLLVMGGSIGMFNCLYTVIQQLLCPSGYDNTFSGLCAALMIIGGIFGATVSAIVVDRTKWYEKTIKFCMDMAVLFGILFLQLTLRPGLGGLILVTCFIFGVMGLATYPVGLEMSAECTFPVSETTSTGLIVLSGQIQSILFITIMQIFSNPLQPDYWKYEVCTIGEGVVPKDMSHSNIVMSVVAISLYLILVVFFHPKLRRLETERGPVKAKNGTGEPLDPTPLNTLPRPSEIAAKQVEEA